MPVTPSVPRLFPNDLCMQGSEIFRARINRTFYEGPESEYLRLRGLRRTPLQLLNSAIIVPKQPQVKPNQRAIAVFQKNLINGQ